MNLSFCSFLLCVGTGNQNPFFTQTEPNVSESLRVSHYVIVLSFGATIAGVRQLFFLFFFVLDCLQDKTFGKYDLLRYPDKQEADTVFKITAPPVNTLQVCE